MWTPVGAESPNWRDVAGRFRPRSDHFPGLALRAPVRAFDRDRPHEADPAPDRALAQDSKDSKKESAPAPAPPPPPALVPMTLPIKISAPPDVGAPYPYVPYPKTANATAHTIGGFPYRPIFHSAPQFDNYRRKGYAAAHGIPPSFAFRDRDRDRDRERDRNRDHSSVTGFFPPEDGASQHGPGPISNEASNNPTLETVFLYPWGPDEIPAPEEMRRRAITSYGIIPCIYDVSRSLTSIGTPCDDGDLGRNTGVWRFLVAQRRDTIAYSEFIKARIGPSDLDRYSALMTRAERDRIAEHSFSQLWHDFWIHVDNRLFHSEFARCAQAFEFNARAIAQSPVQALEESPWGFPKGRRCPGETDLECALREFEEETRIDRRALHPVEGAPVVHEYYVGTDRKLYRTVYYVCLLTYYPSVPVLLTPQHIRKMTITEEIGSLRWTDVGEAFAIMDASRRKVVRAVHQYLLLHGEKIAHAAAQKNHRGGSTGSTSSNSRSDTLGKKIHQWYSTFLGHTVPYGPVQVQAGSAPA